MSQENVEIVRRVFAETERGNFWLPELFDPSVRMGWLPTMDLESETVGLESMGRLMTKWMETWERIELTAERIVDAGDRIVLVAVWRARGRSSGVATEWRFGAVWTLRNGKVIEADSYEDPAEAFEAAGLSE